MQSAHEDNAAWCFLDVLLQTGPLSAWPLSFSSAQLKIAPGKYGPASDSKKRNLRLRN